MEAHFSEDIAESLGKLDFESRTTNAQRPTFETMKSGKISSGAMGERLKPAVSKTVSHICS